MANFNSWSEAKLNIAASTLWNRCYSVTAGDFTNIINGLSVTTQFVTDGYSVTEGPSRCR